MHDQDTQEEASLTRKSFFAYRPEIVNSQSLTVVITETRNLFFLVAVMRARNSVGALQTGAQVFDGPSVISIRIMNLLYFAL